MAKECKTIRAKENLSTDENVVWPEDTEFVYVDE